MAILVDVYLLSILAGPLLGIILFGGALGYTRQRHATPWQSAVYGSGKRRFWLAVT